MATTAKSRKRSYNNDKPIEETDTLYQTIRLQFTDQVVESFYTWIYDTRQQYSSVVRGCINENDPLIRYNKLRELSKKMPETMQWIATARMSDLIRFGWQVYNPCLSQGIIEKLPADEVTLVPSNHGLSHLRNNELPYAVGRDITVWLDEVRLIVDPSLRPDSCLLSFNADNNLLSEQYFSIDSRGQFYHFKSIYTLVEGCQILRLSSTFTLRLFCAHDVPISRSYTFPMVSIDLVMSRNLLQK